MKIDEYNAPEVLAELFKETGKTQQGVARKAGVSRNTIPFWLSRCSSPNLQQLCRVLRAMGKQLEVHDIENRG